MGSSLSALDQRFVYNVTTSHCGPQNARMRLPGWLLSPLPPPPTLLLQTRGGSNKAKSISASRGCKQRAKIQIPGDVERFFVRVCLCVWMHAPHATNRSRLSPRGHRGSRPCPATSQSRPTGPSADSGPGHFPVPPPPPPNPPALTTSTHTHTHSAAP